MLIGWLREIFGDRPGVTTLLGQIPIYWGAALLALVPIVVWDELKSPSSRT